MKRTELRLVFASPEKYAAEPVKICGWLRTSRNSKSVPFKTFSTSSGAVPVLFSNSLSKVRAKPFLDNSLIYKS